jgi:hypothetical protein
MIMVVVIMIMMVIKVEVKMEAAGSSEMLLIAGTYKSTVHGVILQNATI